MTPTTIQPKWIALSERIYRALLVLYPADYRREYGTLMVQVFRDVCRDQYHRQGLPGMVLWWCTTFLDLAFTVIEQRRKVRFTLSRSSFLQFTGVLLVLAGVCSALVAISQLQPGSHYTYHGVYQLSMFMILPAFGFTAFGIWGLALRYGDSATLLGRLLLYVAGAGALVAAIGFTITRFDDSFWQVGYFAMVAHAVGIAVFGMLNLQVNALPVPRLLVLAAGLVPLLLVTGVFQADGYYGVDIPQFAALLFHGGVWMVLGYLVQKTSTRTASLAA